MNDVPQPHDLADDGWGDPVAQSGSQMGISAPPSSPKYVPQSAGSFTVPLTLSASASGKQGMYQAGGGASASVGPITIAVHAQPYNFHKTSATDNGDGTLTFTYGWSSTSGNKGDLTTCYSHERVTYNGGNPYYPPAPFALSQGLDNPTILPPPNSRGGSMASTSGTDTHYVWASSPPYSTITVSAAQRYEFDDDATGEANVLIPGPDSSPTITRAIDVRIPYTPPWWYSINKHGLTAWLPLQ